MHRLPVVIITLLVTAGAASARPFGEQGQYIVTTDAKLDVSYTSVASEGMEESHATTYAIVLAGDYTRFHRVTLGAEVGFEGEVGDPDAVKGFRFGGRVGYVVPLANGVSLWPRAGLAYGNTTYQFAMGQYTVGSVEVSASLPLVFNPYPLIIVGLAPRFDHDLRATAGDDTAVPKRTRFGVHLMLGFWFE